MEKKDLLRHIKGETSTQENQEIIFWLRADAENQKTYSLLKATLISEELATIETADTDDIHTALKNKIKKKKRLYATSIAATIVLLISLGYFYTIMNGSLDDHENSRSLVESTLLKEATTKSGGKLLVTLPDGSTALLNAESKLVYAEKFGNHSREVTLIGEALFDITHNPKKPFIVKTADFNIKVLGTTFNVKSYTEDKKTETTLISGKVELIRDKGKSILLKPSQKAVFNKKDKKIVIKEVVSSEVIAWKNGSLVFKKTSMEQVMLDLERKYNVKIIINSQKLLNYEYTGTFDHLTIDEVLNILAISSPITYKKTDGAIVLKMK